MKKLFVGILMVCLVVVFVNMVGAEEMILHKPWKSLKYQTKHIESYTYPVVVVRNTNIREGKGTKHKKIGMLSKGTVIRLVFRKSFDPYSDDKLWLSTCNEEMLTGWVNEKLEIDGETWERIYKTSNSEYSEFGKLLRYTGKEENQFLQVQYIPFQLPHKRITCGFIYKRNLMFFKTGAEAREYAEKMENKERIKKQKIAKEKRQKRIKKQKYELSLAKKNGCILYLKKWSWYNERSYVYAKGEVQNISGRRLGLVKVLVTWFDKNGTYITHDYSYLALNVLMSNQSSPFEIMERKNPLMARANIKFLINNVEIKIYQR